MWLPHREVCMRFLLKPAARLIGGYLPFVAGGVLLGALGAMAFQQLDTVAKADDPDSPESSLYVTCVATGQPPGEGEIEPEHHED